jgi:hypothetical protein
MRLGRRGALQGMESIRLHRTPFNEPCLKISTCNSLLSTTLRNCVFQADYACHELTCLIAA